MFKIIAYYIALLLVTVEKSIRKVQVWAKLVTLRRSFNLHKSVRIKSTTRIFGNGKIIIGEGTYIGTNTFIVSNPMDATITIGKYCRISHNVHIRTSGYDINDMLSEKPNTTHNMIVIGDFCWIGKGVYIRAGIKIGNGVIIGANSVVTKSFPDNVVIAGIPAKVIKELIK